MSLSDYLVASSQQTPIHVAKDVRPLILELKRIGTNLNQITAKVNSGVVSAIGLQETAAELHRIYEEISRIARRD